MYIYQSKEAGIYVQCQVYEEQYHAYINEILRKKEKEQKQ
jgi:hypothetical protein